MLNIWHHETSHKCSAVKTYFLITQHWARARIDDDLSNLWTRSEATRCWSRTPFPRPQHPKLAPWHDCPCRTIACKSNWIPPSPKSRRTFWPHADTPPPHTHTELMLPCGRGVMLATHLHIPPRLRMSGGTSPLPHTSSWCVQGRTYFSLNIIKYYSRREFSCRHRLKTGCYWPIASIQWRSGAIPTLPITRNKLQEDFHLHL